MGYDRLSSASDLMRIRAVYITCLSLIGVQIFNLVQIYFNYGGWTSDSTVTAVAIIFATGLMISFKFHNRFAIGAIGFTAMVFGGVFASAMIEGRGINSAVLPLLPICIFLAGFISGWRMALAVGVACLILTAALFGYSTFGVAESVFSTETFTSRNGQRATQLSIACIVTMIVSSSMAHSIHGLFGQNEANIRRIREADRRRTKFFSSLSHEIRTPLNGIVGMSGLLLNTQLSSQQRQYTEMVTQCSDKLLEVMGNVMEMSQIDNERMVLQPETVDIHTLAQNLIAKHAENHTDQDVIVGLHIATEVPKFLFADQKRLELVINHLLTNAINFTDKGSVNLLLNGRVLDETTFNLCVYVRDTGIGMKEADIKEIYEPFHQLDNSLSRQHEGTGLGLSLCKEIIEFMGGRINVVSKKGVGSTFFFELVLPIEHDAKQPRLVASNDIEVMKNQPPVSFGRRVRSN